MFQSKLLCVTSSEKRKELLTSQLRIVPALLWELLTLFI